MDALALLLLATVLNGISMLIGTYIGLKMGAKATGEEFEKRAMKIINSSPTAQAAKKMLGRLDVMLESRNLIDEATKFFKEAAELVSSPEAKNFFGNIAELMKSLSTTQKISLPPKPPHPKKPKTFKQ